MAVLGLEKAYVMSVIEKNYNDVDRVLSRRFGMSIVRPEIKFDDRYLGKVIDPLDGKYSKVVMWYQHKNQLTKISIKNLGKAAKDPDSIVAFLAHEEGHRRHHLLMKKFLGEDYNKQRTPLTNNKSYESFRGMCSDIYTESVAYSAQISTIKNLGLYGDEQKRVAPKFDPKVDGASFRESLKNFVERVNTGNRRENFWKLSKRAAAKGVAEKLSRKSNKYFQNYCSMESHDALCSLMPRFDEIRNYVLREGKNRNDMAGGFQMTSAVLDLGNSVRYNI